MALISCPGCGKMVSDKAETCIQCGYALKETGIIERRCAECGELLGEEDVVCPHCGCPIEDDELQNGQKPQQVEVTKVHLAVDEKKKKIIIFAIIAVCILAISSILLSAMKKNFDQKKAEKTAAEARTDYQEKLSDAVSTMLTGAATAERAGGLIHDVWYNAIYEQSDDKTDAYTKPKGYFVSDFNDALSNLMSDDDFKIQIESIKSNQNKTQNLMRTLKNPPKEYQEAYDALKDYYDAYIELVGCAVNPSGNLSSYTEKFNDADTNVSNCYDAMKIYTN